MKKLNLILATLGLFALTVFIAFSQGAPSVSQVSYLPNLISPVTETAVVYTGIRLMVANGFAVVINALMALTGNSIMLSILLLAFLVELVLLYPSIKIQLKQKKIHLFHKKLVDRFNKGDLSISDTKGEINKLYDVNEKIHSRGSVFVVIQVLLFFAVVWGLSLMVYSPNFLNGSWDALNISLLSKPSNYVIPVLAGLSYFLHSLIKTYSKEREDYISTEQTMISLFLSVVTSVIIYVFASTFALALTLYTIALIAFSTIRYLVVEEHSRSWGGKARKELMEMIMHAEPHKNRFQYISRKWNHLPIVRYLNFHLLEEAISMSLGLLLALNFFGVFGANDASQMTFLSQVPSSYADEIIQSNFTDKNKIDEIDYNYLKIQ